MAVFQSYCPSLYVSTVGRRAEEGGRGGPEESQETGGASQEEGAACCRGDRTEERGGTEKGRGSEATADPAGWGSGGEVPLCAKTCLPLCHSTIIIIYIAIPSQLVLTMYQCIPPLRFYTFRHSHSLAASICNFQPLRDECCHSLPLGTNRRRQKSEPDWRDSTGRQWSARGWRGLPRRPASETNSFATCSSLSSRGRRYRESWPSGTGQREAAVLAIGEGEVDTTSRQLWWCRDISSNICIYNIDISSFLTLITHVIMTFCEVNIIINIVHYNITQFMYIYS